MKNILYTILIFTIIIHQGINGQDNDSTHLVEWNLGYISDAGRNFSGGIKQGNTYMGLAKVGVLLKSNKFWNGGKFNFEIMNTHGGKLSGNYVGDKQVISNIENGNYTFIEKFYFRQDLLKFSIILGLQDLNEEFCTSEYGGALTNSSFGIHSTFPLNFSIPLYPKTALGLAIIYNLSENVAFRTSIFDGCAGSLEDDPHNIDWSASSKDGLLNVNEIEYRSGSNKQNSLKIGSFFHSAHYIDPNDSLRIEKGNFGFYSIIDQKIYEKGTKKVGVFGQFAIFPSKANVNNTYLGAGFDFAGLIEKRPNDCMAVGCAYSRVFDKTYECDIEYNYSFAFGSHFFVQPAFHYIIHPGANKGLNNAFAGFIRVSVSN
jgi:porin